MRKQILKNNFEAEKVYQINSDGSFTLVGRKPCSLLPNAYHLERSELYGYDANGNLIWKNRMHGGLLTDGTYFRQYNELGQLVNISYLNGTLVESYIYDGTGERIKSENHITNTIIYTPFREFMQIHNGSGVFNYTYVYEGNILVMKINPDGSKYYYHPDHLGSTSLITNEAGEVVSDLTYYPYGGILSGKTDEVKLYEGMEFSESIGDYNYNFRNYNPELRIPTKADSIFPNIYNPQDLNRYMFERGNPYSYVDPSGHSTINRNDPFNIDQMFSELIPDWGARNGLKKMSSEVANSKELTPVRMGINAIIPVDGSMNLGGWISAGIANKLSNDAGFGNHYSENEFNNIKANGVSGLISVTSSILTYGQINVGNSLGFVLEANEISSTITGRDLIQHSFDSSDYDFKKESDAYKIYELFTGGEKC